MGHVHAPPTEHGAHAALPVVLLAVVLPSVEEEDGGQCGGMRIYGSANETIFSKAGAATSPP
jgi:hypothetical protein